MRDELEKSDELRKDWNGNLARYVPCPIALDDIEVPAATRPLVEVVAKNMHKSWVTQRERLGWMHGATIDIQEKTHPDMVNFEKLHDEAQEGQRKAAAGTLKLMVCAGCSINQLGEVGGRQFTKVPNALMSLLELLACHLHEVWCKSKVEMGYVYGITRDEKKKTHPQIMPYYLLEIQDRYFDQHSAQASIMHILNSGCSISPPKRRRASYEMDYTDSVYFNELQRRIAAIRHDLANEERLKNEWKNDPNHQYIAKPLDLDAVRVPQEVVYLIDLCAESMHDSWMETNERQGWSYGEETDNDHKKNPSMVPYNDLPAEHRRADQISAEQTLRSILACGYKITKPRAVSPEIILNKTHHFTNQSPDGGPRKPSWFGGKTGPAATTEEPPSPGSPGGRPRAISRKPTSARARMLRKLTRPRTQILRGRCMIPPELQELIEVIAYHLHETWSQEKMKQGYTYAAVRNNELKHHPNLVPYYILSTSDRAFDVGIAEEAIMCVLKTGCNIMKPARILVGDLISEEFKDKWTLSNQAMDAAIEEDEKIESMMKLMDASEKLNKKGHASTTSGVSWAVSPRGRKASLVEMTASVLEDSIQKMSSSPQKKRAEGDESEDFPVGDTGTTSRSMLCRVVIALSRILFDYRLPISPETYVIRVWSLFITIATVYFILAVPVRLGFQEQPSLWSMALECTLEMCFLYDLIVQLRLGFFNTAGELVMEVTVIRRNYIRTWLFSDVVASVPVQTLELVAGDSMKNIMFMKLLRLLKILRMFRLSKKRSSLVSQTPSFMRMVQLLAFFIGGLHYMSCIYWATVEHIGFDDDPDHHWVPDTSYTDASFSEKCKSCNPFIHILTLHKAPPPPPPQTFMRCITRCFLSWEAIRSRHARRSTSSRSCPWEWVYS
jgi:hypothetical protein